MTSQGLQAFAGSRTPDPDHVQELVEQAPKAEAKVCETPVKQLHSTWVVAVKLRRRHSDVVLLFFRWQGFTQTADLLAFQNLVLQQSVK